MTALPDDVSGKYHNDMLHMASDTVLRIKTLPGLMLVMLESGGWRRLERPLDHRIFENATIADWVLGPPWAGLHFPDWATVYAVLKKNVDVGWQCVKHLQKAGAPSPTAAELAFQTKTAKDAELLPKHDDAKGGRGRETPSNRRSFSRPGTTAIYLAHRLKRDSPDTFAALERGEFKSVYAAACAAGLIHIKTPVEQLRHWWTKASPDDRQEFLRFLRTEESHEPTPRS